MTTLDLGGDVGDLTATLIDIPSESRHETQIADQVERALRACAHLHIQRFANTVVAQCAGRTTERVLIAGHLDTVPAAGNLPHHLDGDALFGLGATDMKGGVAVALHAAATVTEPQRAVTYVFYECEEVSASENGLERLAQTHPDLLAADLAILLEPSNGGIEAGCQGTLRAEIAATGVRAHSARSWLGSNAIHGAGEILRRLQAYEPRQPFVDGLQYREGLQAVGITGGVAGNVIPDACVVTVNYRFAPDRNVEEATAHLREVFDGFEVTVVDGAPGARPGLDAAPAQEFIAVVGATPEPKFGWTDVARFAAAGTPALNFGPGNPSLAHTATEHVSVQQIRWCAQTLAQWLRGSATPPA